MPQAATKSKLPEMLGHNNPPEPTPFEESRDEIENLYLEAKNWADGTPIETQAQADEVARLKDLLRAAAKRADERRATENKPFDDGKAEVQARYAPLIADTKSVKGKTVLATEALNRALTPYLQKLERERMAAAQKAREEAEAKQRAAQEAIRTANAADLEAREKAEAMLVEAKKADAAATKAENDKAQAKGSGRAQGLRTSYRAEITDAGAFAKWIWTTRRADMDAFLNDFADRLVREGTHVMPGVTVHHERGL